MNETRKNKNLLTIGELSKLTGISTFTLRMWEKRYGAPHSQRLPSGHRRYPREEVPRLRAIARALDSGYRAGKVVCGTLEELQKLLGVKLPLSAQMASPGEGVEESLPSGQVKLEQWIEAVHRFDENTLSQGFFEEWSRQGPLKFVLNFAVPFVYHVGKGWETGELTVSQEHFASERLEHFLSGMWRRMNERKVGPAVLLTTLPGELHRLGIQMCSVVSSLTEAKMVYLGPNTPCEDIVSAVEQSDARILCISISAAMSPARVEDYLVEICAGLNKNVDIVIGGNGAPEGIPGIMRFDGFPEYFDWLTARSKK